MFIVSWWLEWPRMSMTTLAGAFSSRSRLATPRRRRPARRGPRLDRGGEAVRCRRRQDRRATAGRPGSRPGQSAGSPRPSRVHTTGSETARVRVAVTARDHRQPKRRQDVQDTVLAMASASLRVWSPRWQRGRDVTRGATACCPRRRSPCTTRTVAARSRSAEDLRSQRRHRRPISRLHSQRTTLVDSLVLLPGRCRRHHPCC